MAVEDLVSGWADGLHNQGPDGDVGDKPGVRQGRVVRVSLKGASVVKGANHYFLKYYGAHAVPAVHDVDVDPVATGNICTIMRDEGLEKRKIT